MYCKGVSLKTSPVKCSYHNCVSLIFCFAALSLRCLHMWPASALCPRYAEHQFRLAETSFRNTFYMYISTNSSLGLGKSHLELFLSFPRLFCFQNTPALDFLTKSTKKGRKKEPCSFLVVQKKNAILFLARLGTNAFCLLCLESKPRLLSRHI